MTVTSATARNDYTSTGGTEFAYTFRILDEDHLFVYVDDVLKTKTTDYTVDGVGDAVGGTVTFLTAVTSGLAVTILRNVPITQEVDYVEHDDFPAEVHEGALDKLTMIVQQQADSLRRTVQFPTSSTSLDGVLPEPEIGKTLEWLSVSPPTLRNVTLAATGVSLPLSATNGGLGQDASSFNGIVRADDGVFSASDEIITQMSILENSLTDHAAADDPHPVYSTGEASSDLRLVKSGTVLTFQRVTGSYLVLGSTRRRCSTLPTVAGGLSASTLYYLYAYWTGTDVGLEASTTGYTVDATTGRAEKTGDTSRRLVGMAYTDGSGAWSTSPLLTLSHAHRLAKTASAYFTTTRSTGSGTYVELNAEIRIPFLAWPDEAVQIVAVGSTSGSSSGEYALSSIGVDGTTAEDVQSAAYVSASVRAPLGLTLTKTVAVGYHYATLLGKILTNACNWYGSATAGERCTLAVTVRG